MNKAFLLLSLTCTLGFYPAIVPGQTSSKPSDAPSPTIPSQTTRPATTISDGSSSGAPSKNNKTKRQPTARYTMNPESVTTTTTEPRPDPFFYQRPVEMCGGVQVSARDFATIIETMKPLTPKEIARLRRVSRAWNHRVGYLMCKDKIDISTWNTKKVGKLISWASANPGLTRRVRSLDCHGNRNVTDQVLSRIIPLFVCLEDLDLSYCRNLTPNSLKLVGQLQNIRSLNVRGTQFNDDALINIANNAQIIKRLVLCYCANIGTRGLRTLRQLGNLEFLEVSNAQEADANACLSDLKKIKISIAEATFTDLPFFVFDNDPEPSDADEKDDTVPYLG